MATEVGIWRLLGLFDELKLPACHLANSLLYEDYPQIFEAIRERQDEIIGHGRTNSERQGALWAEDEARLIADVTDTIERHEGRRPRGWMGPMMSESAETPELLKKAGYEFIMDWPCDDQPIWMRTDEGSLMVVPYPIEINDLPQILYLHQNAAEFTTILVDQFEEMLRQSERQPLVCAVSLHTNVMGQPHRIHRLRDALEGILAHPDFDRVWVTRPGEIYDFCRTLPPHVVPGG